MNTLISQLFDFLNNKSGWLSFLGVNGGVLDYQLFEKFSVNCFNNWLLVMYLSGYLFYFAVVLEYTGRIGH